MHFLISSNFKKYFDTYIDFVDHYWISYFDKKKIKFTIIPNTKNCDLSHFNKKNIKL